MHFCDFFNFKPYKGITKQGYVRKSIVKMYIVGRISDISISAALWRLMVTKFLNVHSDKIFNYEQFKVTETSYITVCSKCNMDLFPKMFQAFTGAVLRLALRSTLGVKPNILFGIKIGYKVKQ